jgi:hypothetical protein
MPCACEFHSHIKDKHVDADARAQTVDSGAAGR